MDNGFCWDNCVSTYTLYLGWVYYVHLINSVRYVKKLNLSWNIKLFDIPLNFLRLSLIFSLIFSSLHSRHVQSADELSDITYCTATNFWHQLLFPPSLVVVCWLQIELQKTQNMCCAVLYIFKDPSHLVLWLLAHERTSTILETSALFIDKIWSCVVRFLNKKILTEKTSLI